MTSTQTDRIDGVTSSSAIKVPVRMATTAAVTLSGLQTIDGISGAANDRVLVKNQTDTTTNGIYTMQSTAWQRDADFDGNRDVTQGTLVLVNLGTVNAGSFWKLTTTPPITIGTTALTFTSTGGTGTISSAMVPVVGAASLGAALTALGGSATGVSLFEAASVAAAVAVLSGAVTGANTFTAAQILSSTTAGAAVETFLTLLRNKGAGIANDFLEAIAFDGMNATPAEKTFARLYAQIVTATAGSEDGQMIFASIVAGTLASRMTLFKGLQLGSPTGGDKGAGTINAAGGLFSNGSAVGVPSFTKLYDSGDQTITAAGALTLAHGLAVIPTMIQTLLHCVSTEANYSAGDYVFIDPHIQGTTASRGAVVVPDATNLNIRFGSDAAVFDIINKSTGTTLSGITPAKWKYVVRAWAP